MSHNLRQVLKGLRRPKKVLLIALGRSLLWQNSGQTFGERLFAFTAEEAAFPNVQKNPGLPYGSVFNFHHPMIVDTFA